MSFLGPGLSARSDFEMELLDAGYMITVDLYNGEINNGEENIAESRAADKPRMSSVFRHLYKNMATLNESV